MTVERDTNLEIEWVDYKRAYDMVPHSWILESLELENVPDNVTNFIMRMWRILGGLTSGEGFSKETAFHLLFVICMIPLTEIIRKVSTDYALKCGL